MFRKPLTLKASSAVHSSNTRKLRQRIALTFACSTEDAGLLLPDNMQSTNFRTYNDAPGVVYLDAAGTPLWYSLGKSDELIPTVYTIRKRPDLLPSVSTLHRATTMVMEGGSALKKIFLTEHTPGLQKGQLVSLRESTIGPSAPASSPYAVGCMLLSSDELFAARDKRRAVLIVHTWKDCLCEIGTGGALPESTPLSKTTGERVIATGSGSKAARAFSVDLHNKATVARGGGAQQPASTTCGPVYTPSEVTQLLRMSLLQCLATLPHLVFPIPGSAFHSNYILPSRPAFPDYIIPRSSSLRHADSDIIRQHITLRNSTYATLNKFLRAAQKSGWLAIKCSPRQQNNIMITSVDVTHPDVLNHRQFLSFDELERSRKAVEGVVRQVASDAVFQINEMWRPHAYTTLLFEIWGLNTNKCYTHLDLKGITDSWPKAPPCIVGPLGDAYVDITDPLLAPLAVFGRSQDISPALQFAQRDRAPQFLKEEMTPLYEIRLRSGERVVKPKHELGLIITTRNPTNKKKGVTTIRGFEPLGMERYSFADWLNKAGMRLNATLTTINKAGAVHVDWRVPVPRIIEYLTRNGFPEELIRTKVL